MFRASGASPAFWISPRKRLPVNVYQGLCFPRNPWCLYLETFKSHTLINNKENSFLAINKSHHKRMPHILKTMKNAVDNPHLRLLGWKKLCVFLLEFPAQKQRELSTSISAPLELFEVSLRALGSNQSFLPWIPKCSTGPY